MGNNQYYNNADLFGKYPPAFYLNRKNQTGTQPISSVEGLEEALRDVSSGGVFTGDVSTSHVWYDTSLNSDIKMTVAVGGLPIDTSVAYVFGRNITSLLNEILFPAGYPTLTPPSASFSINPTTTLYEVAAVPSVTFTASFSRGSISPQYTATSPYRSGLPNTYTYTGTGLTTPVSSTSLTNVQTINVTVVQGNQSWTASVSHDAGVQPYDSKGNIYSTPLSAGTVSASPTITIEGAYPLFATTVTIGTLTKQTLVSMLTTSSIDLSLVSETGGNKQKFEIPTLWPYTDLTGIRTYNPGTGFWEYELGSAVASLTRWTVTDVTETIQGVVVNYKQYTYNGINRADTIIRIEI